jgi:hypothetical protein
LLPHSRSTREPPWALGYQRARPRLFRPWRRASHQQPPPSGARRLRLAKRAAFSAKGELGEVPLSSRHELRPLRHRVEAQPLPREHRMHRPRHTAMTTPAERDEMMRSLQRLRDTAATAEAAIARYDSVRPQLAPGASEVTPTSARLNLHRRMWRPTLATSQSRKRRFGGRMTRQAHTCDQARLSTSLGRRCG